MHGRLPFSCKIQGTLHIVSPDEFVIKGLIMAYTPKYENAWNDNITTLTADGSVEWKRISIGDLILSSGAVVACDPLTIWQTKPFTHKVAPGHYAVHITTGRHLEEKYPVPAYALLELEPVKPNRWEIALPIGQNISVLGTDQFWGYGVDTGTGCFMDVEAVSLLREKKDELLNIQLKRRSEKWLNFRLEETTGLNCITFRSGWGDGTYPSYWGFNERNEIVCLLTDFQIVR